MIRCILIDDEPNALKLVAGYISRIPSLQLHGQFFDAIEAIEYLRNQRVDVIITDINMPVISGLQLASFLPDDQKFIFITAHAEYALSSFSYHVVDYLLKPIEFIRFQKAIDKVGTIEKDPSTPGIVNKSPDHIFVRSSGQLVRVSMAEILYVRGEKEYVSLQFKDNRLLIYKRMKEMEQLLPANFRRIHTSYIVNTDHIQKVVSNQVILGEMEIPISDSYRDSFLDYINNQLI
jgi:two-component system LytT family response regulator